MIASKHETDLNGFNNFKPDLVPKNNHIRIVIVYRGAIGEIWHDFVS